MSPRALRDFRAAVEAASTLPTDPWHEVNRAFQKLPHRICALLCQSGETDEWQVLLPAKMARALAAMLPK